MCDDAVDNKNICQCFCCSCLMLLQPIDYSVEQYNNVLKSYHCNCVSCNLYCLDLPITEDLFNGTLLPIEPLWLLAHFNLSVLQLIANSYSQEL